MGEEKILEELEYWKLRCEKAETYIDLTSCDPDITTPQLNAYHDWLEVVGKLPKEPDCPLCGDDGYTMGSDFTGTSFFKQKCECQFKKLIKNKGIMNKENEKPKTITHTKGNVIVEEINVGDIHYEYEFGVGRKTEVITKPVQGEDGCWTWKSRNLTSGIEMEYLVNPLYPHYSANLYDCEAYNVDKYI